MLETATKEAVKRRVSSGIRWQLMLSMFLLLYLDVAGHCRTDSAVTRQTDSLPPLILLIPLADTAVVFHWHGNPASPLLFFVIHDDENTASATGYCAMHEYGASLLELKNDGKYLYTLLYDSTTFTFNPNRIFSLNGIESALLQFGPCSDRAVVEIDLSARMIAGNLLHLPQFIVALHNNANQGFSINSYVKDHRLKSMVDMVFVNPMSDPDDFYFVVDPYHFMYLMEKGYNVVLEACRDLQDDGSLSVYCRRMGIPYINIEAEHGHLEEQVRMLDDIRNLLPAIQVSPGN